MINKLLVIIFLFAGVSFVKAQEEVEVDLQMNTLLMQHAEERQQSRHHKMQALTDTLNLPFIDDFSYDDFYPDTAKWVDNFVFVNRDYPIAPPSIGVATMDGLNQNGAPHNPAASANSSAIADYLTSKYIRLGNPLTPADSVYLSFYYQAQGRGNTPELYDSLILQFYEPLGGWRNVWGRRGYSPSVSDTGFHLVMVPVTDVNYFTNSFRFRFVNHATLSGNNDHWHVDYVYLNSARTISDTVFNDVAFVYNASSFLKQYQHMPWEQFQPAEMADLLRLFIRNNSMAPATTSYKDTLRNSSSSVVWTYDGNDCSVAPFMTSGYANCQSHAYPLVDYSFPVMTDTTSFVAHHRINFSGDTHNENDILTFRQKFYNFYAYDDGTTEAGYGISANNSSFAYKITLNTTDTLRAFQVFFNPIHPSVVSYPMRFVVWSNNSGTPGTIIRKDSVIYPRYSADINEFVTYHFDTLNSLVLGAGTYFFGWIQHTPNVLNIGLDKNINSVGKAFYNAGMGWLPSTIKGAVMLRPVFGKNITVTGIEDNNINTENLYTIFPNPAVESVTVKSTYLHDNSNISVSLFDSYGRLVLKKVFQNTLSIDVSGFSNGIYFLVFEKDNAVPFTKKFIIANQ